MSDAPAGRLAAAISEVVRAHRASSPLPRGLPYLGLEHASGTGFHLLDALAARGIFRKYELVLDLGAGLGGTSRWLAARLGCDVIATALNAAEAVAARALTRRAGLGAQVHSIAAQPDALPVRSGAFTHVWIIESLPRLRDVDAVLAEARRALRPGGTLAVQDLVAAGSSESVAGWHLVSTDDRCAALRDAGFVDLQVRDRSGDAPERSARITAARERLRRRLDEDASLAPCVAERRALADGLAAGRLRVVQLLARRL